MPISIDTKQVKQQQYSEKKNPMKSFTVPSKTNNKVWIQQYYKLSPPPLDLPPKMMTLKRPPHLFALFPPNPINITNLTRHNTWFPHKKVPLYFMGKTLCLFSNGKSYVGVYAASLFARKCGLNLVNILDFAKRIIWQNRSVGWSIIYDLECCQLISLRAHHWDFMKLFFYLQV